MKLLQLKLVRCLPKERVQNWPVYIQSKINVCSSKAHRMYLLPHNYTVGRAKKVTTVKKLTQMHNAYRKFASSNTSRLEAHGGFFRLPN